MGGQRVLRVAFSSQSINSDEVAKVDYILQNYSEYKTFTDEKKYYEYVATVDTGLLGIPATSIDADRSEKLLGKWVDTYPWETVKQELLLLSSHSSSSDPVLKFIDSPVRLEFLAALAVKSRRPTYRVKPNYRCDDEGLPTSTAGGNQGDIECLGANNILVEVTMAEGRTQVMMEGWPVKRHLEEFKDIHSDAGCVFVAPTLYADTKDQFEWAYERKQLYTAPFTIKEFVEELDLEKSEFETVPE